LTTQQQQIVAAYVAELGNALTPVRLSAYKTTGADDLDMLVTYFWNVALCRELYPSLGALEITMRNRVHEVLTHYVGRPDWYDYLTLGKREREQIATARLEIRRSKPGELAKGLDPVTPGRVVAFQTLGFWTSLLSKHYGHLWTANSAALIQQAFPNLHPSHQHRSYVHDRFNRIRLLRNRVSHHEPIWRGVRMQSGQFVSLERLHEDVIDAIGWSSSTMQATVRTFDRFPHILKHGQAEANRGQ
jgi:hypothetical protein